MNNVKCVPRFSHLHWNELLLLGTFISLIPATGFTEALVQDSSLTRSIDEIGVLIDIIGVVRIPFVYLTVLVLNIRPVRNLVKYK